jgi:hypothetical protein
MDLW